MKYGAPRAQMWYWYQVVQSAGLCSLRVVGPIGHTVLLYPIVLLGAAFAQTLVPKNVEIEG